MKTLLTVLDPETYGISRNAVALGVVAGVLVSFACAKIIMLLSQLHHVK